MNDLRSFAVWDLSKKHQIVISIPFIYGRLININCCYELLAQLLLIHFCDISERLFNLFNDLFMTIKSLIEHFNMNYAWKLLISFDNSSI